MAKPKYSIVIPCYNECDRLTNLVESYRAAIGSRTDIELILVDNGSVDKTSDIVQTITSRADMWFVRTVYVRRNRGYGFGIMAGLDTAHGMFIAWTHADMRLDPQNLLSGFDLIANDEVPSRSLVRGVPRSLPLLEQLASIGVDAFAAAMLGPGASNFGMPPKIIHRDFLKQVDAAPYDHAFDLYVILKARKLGYSIIDQPVTLASRSRNLGNQKRGLGKLIAQFRRDIASILGMRKLLRGESGPQSNPKSGTKKSKAA